MNTLSIETSIEQDPSISVPDLMTRVFVDGQPLVAYESEGLAIDIDQLIKSMQHPGEYFIVTCTCGDAGCGGVFEGIGVVHEPGVIRWALQGLGSALRGFAPEQVLAFERCSFAVAVERGVQKLRDLVTTHDLDTVPSNNRLYVGAQAHTST
jgi:hypothetical protein